MYFLVDHPSDVVMLPRRDSSTLTFYPLFPCILPLVHSLCFRVTGTRTCLILQRRLLEKTLKVRGLSTPRGLYDLCSQTIHSEEARQCACFTTTQWNEAGDSRSGDTQHDHTVARMKKAQEERLIGKRPASSKEPHQSRRSGPGLMMGI